MVLANKCHSLIKWEDLSEWPVRTLHKVRASVCHGKISEVEKRKEAKQTGLETRCLLCCLKAPVLSGWQGLM